MGNLISMADRTKDEARSIAQKGGRASGEARRKQRDIREAFEALLDREWDTEDGKLTGAERIALAKFNAAVGGNIRAIADIEDRLYGKAKQAVQLTGANNGPVEVRKTQELPDLSGVPTESLLLAEDLLYGYRPELWYGKDRKKAIQDWMARGTEKATDET